MISVLTHELFRNVLFNTQLLWDFPNVVLLLVPNLIWLWLESIVCMISTALNLLIFFKKQTFGFNYFFCVFCFLFYWFPLFIISYFLLTLGLICLSSSSLFKLEFRLLTWEHFAFLGFPDRRIKNPPTMQETPVWFLGRADPLEKG